MSLITPDGTLSFPSLFQPRMPPNPRPGQKPRYQCVLLFSKDDMTAEDNDRLTLMKKAAFKVLSDKWGAKVEAMLASGVLRWPFRKDWVDGMGDQRYDPEKWQCYISPWSEQAPGIVSRYRGADGKPTKIIDASELYAGAVVRLSVNPFAYDQSGNKGVNFGLQNVQKRRDGDRLDNRRSAQDEFDAEEPPTADLAGDDAPLAAAHSGEQPVMGKGLADLFT